MKLVDTVSKVLGRKGRDVWSVAPDASVYAALEVLASHRIGAALVMEGDRLVGIFSERDYARNIILKGRSSRKTRVSDLMIRKVISVSPRHKVAQCMSIMTESRIRHLPVIEDEKVVGVVSIGDLVNWIISAQEEEIHHLEEYIAGKYPG